MGLKGSRPPGNIYEGSESVVTPHILAITA